jgi:beta-xylosidase
MITPIGFDSGGLSFAESKGIGHWRWIKSGSIITLMESMDKTDEGAIQWALCIPETNGFRFYERFNALTTGGQYIDDLDQLLETKMESAS